MDAPVSLCSASGFSMLSSMKEDFAMKHQTVLGSKQVSPGVCKNRSLCLLP